MGGENSRQTTKHRGLCVDGQRNGLHWKIYLSERNSNVNTIKLIQLSQGEGFLTHKPTLPGFISFLTCEPITVLIYQLLIMSKIVFITGATAGFGEACAKKFAANGYDLIINGRRTERLESLADNLEKKYNIAVFQLPFDVRDEK